MDDDNRSMKITELRAQIDRAAYEVDVDAVADAFVTRMLALRRALRGGDVRALLGDAALAEI